MSHSPVVIAAIDLDSRAEGIIRQAARNAAAGGMHLLVAHVVDHLGLFESDHIPVYNRAELKASLERYARAWVLGLLHHLDLPSVEVVVRTGNPRQEIATLAEERGARTVVAGKSWVGPFGALAGLAADKRIRALGCEVLTVGRTAGEELVRDPGLRTSG